MKIPSMFTSNGSYCRNEQLYEIALDNVEVSLDLEDENDFSEYLWMENEEEFDKMEMQRLEEEELMEQCMEAMLADELWAELEQEHEESLSETTIDNQPNIPVSPLDVEKSDLNPLAAEFVPSVALIPTST